MSAPDPVAALRAFVAAETTFPCATNWDEDEALRESAPALLACVERLEAALATLAIAMLPPV